MRKTVHSINLLTRSEEFFRYTIIKSGFNCIVSVVQSHASFFYNFRMCSILKKQLSSQNPLLQTPVFILGKENSSTLFDHKECMRLSQLREGSVLTDNFICSVPYKQISNYNTVFLCLFRVPEQTYNREYSFSLCTVAILEVGSHP